MSGTDYLYALGAGASFDTKKIVTALVEAERAPAKARIERQMAESDATISGLGQAVSVLNVVQGAAERLNDAKDFKGFTVSNSQTNSFTATASTGARSGSNSVNVTQIAQEQRSTSNTFTSSSAALNDGEALTLSLSIGSNSVTTTDIEVANPTLASVVAAINEADLGVAAELIDTGGNGDNYRIQLIGESGSEKAFSLSSTSSDISFTQAQEAKDALLTVNNIDFTRSTNVIDDVITGVTMTLNSTTDGAASVGINTDKTEIRANIVDFVTIYNEASRQLKELSSSAVDGPLAGDSIFRGLTRNLRNLVLATSSSPGTAVTNLSDMGISINKTGQLEVDDTKLDKALANNYEDVVKVFSANTDDQSVASTDPQGLAGDLSKIIDEMTGSDSYLNTQQTSLRESNSKWTSELTELEERMTRVEERYSRQFLAMQQIIDSMNTTSESLKSSLENLPFNNKD